jgi:hypothetical protein
VIEHCRRHHQLITAGSGDEIPQLAAQCRGGNRRRRRRACAGPGLFRRATNRRRCRRWAASCERARRAPCQLRCQLPNQNCCAAAHFSPTRKREIGSAPAPVSALLVLTTMAQGFASPLVGRTQKLGPGPCQILEIAA